MAVECKRFYDCKPRKLHIFYVLLERNWKIYERVYILQIGNPALY